ncbi:MAG: DUF5683 domain-containing protein [Puia sp.]|nr:DUF5683 domain-containing protein [Puia sp.]
MKRVYFFFTLCYLLVFQLTSYCQKKDSLLLQKKDSVLYISSADAKTDTPNAKDSLSRKDSTLAARRRMKKQFDPHKATLYSAIMPGLGQIYNHKYWKLPLVYAAVGIPAYTYFYNKKWYKRTQYALTVVLTGTADTTATWRDSASKVDKQLQIFIQYNDPNDLRSYRNEFRKNQDYSVLFFLLFWGLNVVDATVDAHLKGFDVGTELSIRIAPSAPGTPNGMGLVFDLHKPKFRTIPLP